MKIYAIRRISQVVFFGLFLYLIWITAYPLKPGMPVDLFVKLDPLVAIASMLAARAFIPGMMLSLIIIGLTVLLGRVFCGWICPLGTTLDISDKLFFKEKRKGGINLRSLKYYILAGLLVSALFTVQAVFLLDPLSLLTRTIVIVFIAPIQIVVRGLAEVFYGWSSSGFGPLASVSMWLSDRMGAMQLVSGTQLYFRQGLLILSIFVGIVGLNSLSRRFWCHNLCPLGALLGLFSHIPILKRAVSEKCVDCAKCTSDCKMAAIIENPRLAQSAECIECMNCIEICPTDAMSFGLRPKPELHPETGLDLSRRRLFQGAGIGLALAAMVKIDPGRKRGMNCPVKLSSAELIRPPGSVAEDQFVAKCVRCGACMKACPTNGLQPALHEAGIEGFWTPILVPRIGCCTEQCNACGEVCPTDAIEPFKIEDKKKIFIGTAVIERDHCIAWYANKKCLVCDEYCSYIAIKWDVVDGAKRPSVDEAKCVGCGICEFACPIQPSAAIRVSSRGDKRGI